MCAAKPSRWTAQAISQRSPTPSATVRLSSPSPPAARREAPLERGPEVVVLRLQPVRRRGLAAAEDRPLRPLGQRQEERCVPAPERLRLGARPQLIQAVLADGFQHPIAQLAAHVL